MVAKVISGQDIKGALNYNEQKVMEGNARCIQANLFKREVGELNFYEKLVRFTDLNERNLRTKTNTLHISLNFDRKENLGTETLNQIATQYMDKIGFGDQPYLVYEHTDAAHPHIHIVTTLIKEDGKRIPIHNLGKNESEKARKEIEITFGLVQAQSKDKDKEQKVVINPVDVKKAIYGTSETKRSIVNIVRMVTRTYKYCSLPELNAVLRQYNVVAERGTEKSKMYARKGLMYCILDKKGKRVGIPVTASAIYGKPTLPFLEKQFKLNKVLRAPFREKVKKTVDKVIQAPSATTKEKFIKELGNAGIAVCFRTNAEGRTYGVTFVDNTAKVVFNGSDLGKPYSANAILKRLAAKKDMVKPYRSSTKDSALENIAISVGDTGSSILKDLVTAEDFDKSSPEAALRLNRRKKKRRRKF